MSNRSRTRKNRRKVKRVLRFGSKAAPKHKCRSGRTGQAHSKKIAAARKQ